MITGPCRLSDGLCFYCMRYGYCGKLYNHDGDCLILHHDGPLNYWKCPQIFNGWGLVVVLLLSIVGVLLIVSML